MLRVVSVVAAPARALGIGVNGPEKRAADSSHLWNAFGIQPIFLYPSRGRMWAAFQESNQAVVDFEIGSKFNFRAVCRLVLVLRQHYPCLAFSQGPPSVDAVLGFAAKIARVPHCLTRPNSSSLAVGKEIWRKLLYRSVDHLTFSAAAAVVCVCDAGTLELQRRMQKQGVKISTIYNGVAVEHYQNKWELERSIVQPPTIGMVAQLTEGKRWEIFLETVSILKNDFPALRALVVGDGPLTSKLQSMADDLGVKQYVQFLGNRSDVPQILQALNVFLFTSKSEGLPVSLIEAMATGVPVVSTRVGGIPELIAHGINGYLCDVDDVNALAAETKRILLNADLQQRFGLESRRRVEAKYTQKVMIESYAELFHHISLEAPIKRQRFLPVARGKYHSKRKASN